MKKALIITVILGLLAILARAADAPVIVATEKTEYYRAHEFSVETFYQTTTPDFEAERGSAGIGVSYYLTENFGARVSGALESFSGEFVDNVSLHALYRVPIKQSAIYGYGGSTFVTAGDEFTIDLGVGVEHRFTPNFGPFIEAGMQKLIDHGAEAVGRVGLRLSW